MWTKKGTKDQRRYAIRHENPPHSGYEKRHRRQNQNSDSYLVKYPKYDKVSNNWSLPVVGDDILNVWREEYLVEYRISNSSLASLPKILSVALSNWVR